MRRSSPSNELASLRLPPESRAREDAPADELAHSVAGPCRDERDDSSPEPRAPARPRAAPPWRRGDASSSARHASLRERIAPRGDGDGRAAAVVRARRRARAIRAVPVVAAPVADVDERYWCWPYSSESYEYPRSRRLAAQLNLSMAAVSRAGRSHPVNGVRRSYVWPGKL